jgi:hypothetical protein
VQPSASPEGASVLHRCHRDPAGPLARHVHVTIGRFGLPRAMAADQELVHPASRRSRLFRRTQRQGANTGCGNGDSGNTRYGMRRISSGTLTIFTTIR